MALVSAVCPECKESVMVDDSKPIIFCINCGSIISLCKSNEDSNSKQKKRELLELGDELHGTDTYTIRQKLRTVSGQANQYLCNSSSGDLVVATLYKHTNPLNNNIVEAMKSVHSPYAARIFDCFSWEKHIVIIHQYYKNGSIRGKTYSFEQLKKTIIPNINEGLKAIHEVYLLHKDLRPANIMLCDDGQSVAITNYGINQLFGENFKELVPQAEWTAEYSAPESYKGIALAETDYYSFGIILYDLFCGKTPYSGMSKAEIIVSSCTQRIPLPKEMPEELKKLIRALTYPDLSNRHDSKSLNKRWKYDEVCAWLRGESLHCPGEIKLTENKTEAKPEVKPVVKPEVNPVVKPEVKPEDIQRKAILTTQSRSSIVTCINIRRVGLQRNAVFGSVTFFIRFENLSKKAIKEASFVITPLNRYGVPPAITLTVTCRGVGPYASGMFNRQNIGEIEQVLWRWDPHNKITGCLIEKVAITYMDGSREVFDSLGNKFMYPNCLVEKFF